MAKTIVFIGDSLTQWFDWQNRFADYCVINLGIAGERTEDLLNRRGLIRAQIGPPPDYIFLMTGINNMLMEQYEFEDFYREIVRNLNTWYRRSRIIVQSLLPVDYAGLNIALISGVNRRLERIAREHDADYLDLYTRFLDKQGKPKSGYFLDDGVHLSARGYEAWARQVDRFLKGPP